MGNKVTVRFYRVSKVSKSTPSVTDALDVIENIDELNNREKVIGGTSIRLEKLERKNGRIYGDLTKIQRENLPAEVHDDGVEQLSISDPLGYSVAFGYDPKLSVIAVQYDVTIISPKKVIDYIAAFDAAYSFGLEPVFKEDAWSKFSGGEVKSFTMRVAVPKNFEFLSDDDPLGSSIAGLAQAYESPYVTVKIGVGNRKQSLASTIISAANNMYSGADVRTMKAKVVGELEEINLLEDMIRIRDEVDLKKVTPEVSYRRRVNVIIGGFSEYQSLLTKMFGKK